MTNMLFPFTNLRFSIILISYVFVWGIFPDVRNILKEDYIK